MIPETVNICGVPHKVKISEDTFNTEMHFGMINYSTCEITINAGMPEEMQKQTLIHEMMHGILVHIGQSDLANDEVLVQTLAAAVNLSFNLK